MLPVMFSVCHHHAEVTTNRHYGTSRPDMTEKLLTGTLSLHTKKKKKKKRERERKFEEHNDEITLFISSPRCKSFDIFLTFPSNRLWVHVSNLCFGAYPSITTQKWGVRGYSIHGHFILIKFQFVCVGGGEGGLQRFLWGG